MDAADKATISYMQDDTLMEPSAFFDENVCNQSVLHKAHMVEQYAIPAKKVIGDTATNAQNKRLNELIEKVKQDVTQSMILNQSRAVKSKCGISIAGEF